MPAKIPAWSEWLLSRLSRELAALENSSEENIRAQLTVTGSPDGGASVHYRGRAVDIDRLVALPVRLRQEESAEPDYGIIASWSPRSRASVAIHPEISGESAEEMRYTSAVALLAQALHLSSEENIPVSSAFQRLASERPEIEGTPSNFVTLVAEATESQRTRAATSVSMSSISTLQALGAMQAEALSSFPTSSQARVDISPLIKNATAYALRERGAAVLVPTYVAKNPLKTTKYAGSMAGRQGVTAFAVYTDKSSHRKVIGRRLNDLEDVLANREGSAPVLGPGIIRTFEGDKGQPHNLSTDVLYTQLPGYPGAGIVSPDIMQTASGEQIRFGYTSMERGRSITLHRDQALNINDVLGRLAKIAEELESGEGESFVDKSGVLRGAGERGTLAAIDFGRLGRTTVEVADVSTGYAATGRYTLTVPWYYDPVSGALSVTQKPGMRPLSEHPEAKHVMERLGKHGISLVRSGSNEISLSAEVFKESEGIAFKQLWGGKVAAAMEPAEVRVDFLGRGIRTPRTMRPGLITSDIKIPGLTAINAAGGRLMRFGVPLAEGGEQTVAARRQAAIVKMLRESGALPADAISQEGSLLAFGKKHEDIFKSYYGDKWQDALKTIEEIGRESGGFLKSVEKNGYRFAYLDFGHARDVAAEEGVDPSLIARYEQAVGDIYLRNVITQASGEINAVFSGVENASNDIERERLYMEATRKAWGIAEDYALTYGVSPISSKMNAYIQFGRPSSWYPHGVPAEEDRYMIERVFSGDDVAYERARFNAARAQEQNIQFLSRYMGGDPRQTRAWLEQSAVAGIYFKGVPMVVSPEYFGKARLNLEDLTTLQVFTSKLVNDKFAKEFIANMLSAPTDVGPFGISENVAYRGWRSMIAGYVATSRGWGAPGDLSSYGAGIHFVDEESASGLYAAMGAYEGASDADYKGMLYAMQDVIGKDKNLLAFKFGEKTMYLPSPSAIVGAAYDPEALLGERGAAGLLRSYHSLVRSLLFGAMGETEYDAQTAFNAVRDFYNAQLIGKVSSAQLNRYLGTMAEASGAYSARYQISYNLAPGETYIPRHRLQSIARTYGFRNASEMFSLVRKLGGEPGVIGLRQPNIGFSPVAMRIVPSSEMTQRYYHSYLSLGYSSKEAGKLARQAMRIANTMQLVGPGIAEAGQGDYDYDPMSIFPAIPKVSRDLRAALSAWQHGAGDTFEDFIASGAFSPRELSNEQLIQEYNKAREYVAAMETARSRQVSPADFVGNTVPAIDMPAYSEFAKSIAESSEKFAELNAIARGEAVLGASGKVPASIGEALSSGWRGKGESPMGVTYNARRLSLLAMQASGVMRARWLPAYQATTPLYQHTLDVENLQRGGLVRFAYPSIPKGKGIGIRTPQFMFPGSPAGGGWVAFGDEMVSYLDKLPAGQRFPEFAERMKRVLRTAATMIAQDVFPAPGDVPEGFSTKSGWEILPTMIAGHMQGESAHKAFSEIESLFQSIYSPGVKRTENKMAAARAKAIMAMNNVISSMTPEEVVSSPAATMFMGALFNKYMKGDEGAAGVINSLLSWTADEEAMPGEMRALMARGAIVGAAQHVWSKNATVAEMPKIAGIVSQAVQALGGLDKLSPELRWTARALMAGQVPITDAYAGERGISFSTMALRRGRVPVRHVAGLITRRLFESEKASLVGRAIGVPVKATATRAMMRGVEAERYLTSEGRLSLIGAMGVDKFITQVGGAPLETNINYMGGNLKLVGVADVLGFTRDESGKIAGVTIADIKAKASNRVPKSADEINEQYLAQVALYEKMIANATPEEIQAAFPGLSAEEAAQIKDVVSQKGAQLQIAYATQGAGGKWTPHVYDVTERARPYRDLSIDQLLSLAGEGWQAMGLPTTQTGAVDYLRSLSERGIISVDESKLAKLPTAESVMDKALEDILQGKPPAKENVQRAIDRVIKRRARPAAPHPKMAGGAPPEQPPPSPPPPAPPASGDGGDDGEGWHRRFTPYVPTPQPHISMPSPDEFGRAIAENLADVLRPKEERPMFPVGFGKLGSYVGSIAKFYGRFQEAARSIPGEEIRSALGIDSDVPLSPRHYVQAAAEAATAHTAGNATEAQANLVDSGFVAKMADAAGALSMSAINDISRLTPRDKDLLIASVAKHLGIDEGDAARIISTFIEQAGGNEVSPLGVLYALRQDFKIDDTVFGNKIPKGLIRAVRRTAKASWQVRASSAIASIKKHAKTIGLGDDATLADIVNEAAKVAASGEFSSDEEAAAVRDILSGYTRLAKMKGVREIGEAEQEHIEGIRARAEAAISEHKKRIGSAIRKLYAAYQRYTGKNLAEDAENALRSFGAAGFMRVAAEIGDEKIVSKMTELGFDYEKMFAEKGGLTKKQQQRVRLHVKRAIAYNVLSTSEDENAKAAAEEYRDFVSRKPAAESALRGIETASEIYEATETVAPETAKEALGEIVPPSVEKAHERVRVMSERLATKLGEYTKTLDEAIRYQRETGKANKELVGRLKELREEIGKIEFAKAYHELRAAEEEARFNGDTEKAERLRLQRQVMAAKWRSGAPIETKTTRELSSIEGEYSIGEDSGIKAVAAKFARGFALFYAMRIWRIATGELTANMQEGEAWAKAASSASLAAGGMGVTPPGARAADIRGAGAAPYAGLALASAKLSRVAGPLPAMLGGAAGTVMGVSVMNAMGLGSMGGIFETIAGLSGGPLALAAGGIAAIGGLAWLYGASKDDYLAAKYLATDTSTLGGKVEQFWYHLASGMDTLFGGTSKQEMRTLVSESLSPGAMSIGTSSQFSAAIQRVVTDNKQIFGGLSKESIASYATRMRQAGVTAPPSFGEAYAAPGEPMSAAGAQKAYYNYLLGTAEAAMPLAWAAEQKIPLEEVAMTMLPASAGAGEVLGLSAEIARRYRYGESYVDPVIEKAHQQRAASLLGTIPREYMAALPQEQRMKLYAAARVTEGENAAAWKMWGQGWSRARQLGVEGWYESQAGKLEDFVTPVHGGSGFAYVNAQAAMYTMTRLGITEQRLGQVQNMMSAAGFSWTDYSQFASQFTGMNNTQQSFIMSAIQWRPIPLTAFAYQNNIPELAVSDVSNAGELTGLPLWTTSFQLPGISGQQLASQIWGADWESGDISGVRHAMVQGGFRAVQYQMMALRAQQARESAGIAAARAHLQYAFTTGRGLEAYGAEFAKPFTWSIPGIGSFNGGSGFWGYESAMFALQTAQQRYQFGIQQQRMNLNEQYWQANYGMNWQQFQAGLEYTQNMWSLQDTQRALQFGWRISDLRENMQFATGRQRRIMERQLKRETTLFSLGEEQIQNQREYQETLWDIQRHRFDEEKEHHREMMALQRDEFEKAKQFFETRVRLEEQYRKLRHKYYEEQYKLQLAQIGITQKWAKIMEQAQKDLQKVKDAQEDQLAKAKVLQSMYPTLLDYLDALGRKWKELILDPLADATGVPHVKLPTQPHRGGGSGSGGGGNRRLPHMRAAGGLILPGENVLHAGEVVVKNNEPLMVVPSYQKDDFMAKYYATHAVTHNDEPHSISATLTVVLATEGLRQIVKEVITEELGVVH